MRINRNSYSANLTFKAKFINQSLNTPQQVARHFDQGKGVLIGDADTIFTALERFGKFVRTKLRPDDTIVVKPAKSARKVSLKGIILEHRLFGHKELTLSQNVTVINARTLLSRLKKWVVAMSAEHIHLT